MRKLRRILGAVAVFAALAAFVVVRGDARGVGAASPVEAPVDLGGGVSRIDLRFPCGPTTCAGWLYLPAGGGARPPVVVLGHGFGGTRDVGLPYFAGRLAEAGMAAFAFDYRHFGASGGTPRQLVDPWSQLDDWRAAIAFVRSRPEVDARRVALLGASLGGGHALIVAAGDPEVRAVVGIAPMVDSSQEGEATVYGVAWVLRVLAMGWADLAVSAVGRGPLLVPAMAREGEFGLVIDDQARRAIDRAVAPGSSYQNAVSARSLFTFDTYDPAEHAHSVRAPVLLVATERDRFAPFSAVRALADRNTKVSVATFEGDHFDVYSPPAAVTAGDAAARFLAQHLKASGGKEPSR